MWSWQGFDAITEIALGEVILAKYIIYPVWKKHTIISSSTMHHHINSQLNRFGIEDLVLVQFTVTAM